MPKEILTDAKLIAAVAEKLGWTHCPGSFKEWPDGSKSYYDWRDPEGIARSSDYAKQHMPWLPSVDACLELLDKEQDFDMSWDSHSKRWWAGNLGFGREHDKSLSRAILKAWLEA